MLTQLADYGRFHEESQVAIDLGEIVERTDAVRPLPLADDSDAAVSSRRGWWIAAASAVLVLLLAAVAIWSVGGNSDFEPADEPAPTTLPEDELSTTVPTTTVLVPPATTTTAPPEESTIPPTVPDGLAVTPQVTDVIETGGSSRLVATDDAVWVVSNGGTVSRIDAATLQVTDTIPVGESLSAMIATPDAVWVAGDGMVSRIDIASRQVTDTIRVGPMSSPLVAEGDLWVQSEEKGLVRIDLASRQITNQYPLPTSVGFWAGVIDGAIWTYSIDRRGQLHRFDLADRQFTDVIMVALGPTEECCVIVEDAIWLVSHIGSVQRFDLTTLEVTDVFDFGEGLSRGIEADGAIWLPHPADDVVYRIDTVLREVTDVMAVGDGPKRPAFADGAIWVPNRGDGSRCSQVRSCVGTVSRIDSVTRQVTHTIKVGVEPFTPLSFDGAIWVPNLGTGTVTRIETR